MITESFGQRLFRSTDRVIIFVCNIIVIKTLMLASYGHISVLYR